jgi:hypothetical protein
VTNLFSPTWVVKDDFDELKWVNYYSLFEKLERRKGSVTRMPNRLMRDAYMSCAFSREKIMSLVTCDERCVRVHIKITMSFLLLFTVYEN